MSKAMQRVQAEDRDRIVDLNRDFYERLWSQTKLYGPENFNTWEVLSTLCESAPRRLEIGPGLRPRLPIEGTVFLDLSQVACDRLEEAGGEARLGTISSIGLEEESFDLLCVFDVLEHIADDDAVLAQFERLLVDGGVLFLSVPLHPHAWTDFDALVGHYRRYEPAELRSLVERHGFEIERSVAYGMQPKSKLLSSLGAWFLRRHHDFAMSYYNRYFFPLGLKRQKRLDFQDGLASDTDIDEVLLICKRLPRRPPSG